MNAIVVYESLWGNTAEVARAIAEGIGEGAIARDTAEATPERVAGAQLLVAGAPVHMGRLPTEKSRAKALERSQDTERYPDLQPPDLSHPGMSEWLATLSRRDDRVHGAAFDTRSMGRLTGSAAKRIASSLRHAGYRRLDPPVGFIVLGQSGPLMAGELDRARAWGERLAGLVQDAR